MAAMRGGSHEFDRVIFHVDMDSFYASCELSQRPELKDKPFVVGADPKEGKGRGVVLACNYVARKFGLHSGMPISQAWQLCPKAYYVSPHFDLYDQVSSRVMKLIRTYADKVEQVSIDEAYLDVTQKIANLMKGESQRDKDEEASIRAHAILIKRAVAEEEKITCSIGVANGKVVAKIATDMNKPDGLTLVRPSGVLDFLAPLDVSKIPGVGKVSQRILLEKFNVRKISELRQIQPEDLKSHFGRNAIWLLNVSRGIDETEVVERWNPVSLSGETTFPEDEGDYSRVRESMNRVAGEVHRRALSDGYLYRNIGIKIRFTGFETRTRSRSLSAYTDSIDVLCREAGRLLSEFYESGKKVRLIGVRVSGLLKAEKEQRSLLEWE